MRRTAIMPQRFAVLFSFDLLGRNPEQSTTNRNEWSLSLSEHEMINVKWRNCKFTVNSPQPHATCGSCGPLHWGAPWKLNKVSHCQSRAEKYSKTPCFGPLSLDSVQSSSDTSVKEALHPIHKLLKYSHTLKYTILPYLNYRCSYQIWGRVSHSASTSIAPTDTWNR